MAIREQSRSLRPGFKGSLIIAAIICAGLVGSSVLRDSHSKTDRQEPHISAAAVPPEPAPQHSGVVNVETVMPVRGGLDRITTQPGSVYAFETAELYAKVSGFLRVQNVDIGDRVKGGQVLVEIDAPELHLDVDQAVAEVNQAKSEVDQKQASVMTAVANLHSAMANVPQSEAELKRAKAQSSFREKQYLRIKSLFTLNSVDEKLVDEKQDEMEAARATEQASLAAIASAKALVTAASAKVDAAKADVVNAQAKVQVSEAALNKAKVVAKYTNITSPFDGVITKRNFDRGDFIRAAERGGEMPVLSIARTDLMRVIVQMPDQLVPFVEPGNTATIEIDAIPGRTFSATVARLANEEDLRSRTMRVELDLPNASGDLYPGMYGNAVIKLRPPKAALSIPSSSVVGPIEDGKGSVYVVREGKAYLTPVRISADDGLHVEIVRGLLPSDQIVSRYDGPISNGVTIRISPKDSFGVYQIGARSTPIHPAFEPIPNDQALQESMP